MAQLPNSPSRAELKADALRRIAAQIPDDQKIPLADFVIHNHGALAATRLEVERIFAELTRDSRRQTQSL
jgi:dephospho-CoA kinase